MTEGLRIDPPEADGHAYEFDVALSFAGSDREVARIIAAVARANGLRVFIDEHHLWESWGRNLNEYLGDVYDGQARFCVILVSRDYNEKPYTNVERRRALDRAMESKAEYILPVRLDDSWLAGLPRATAYLDLRQMSVVEVATAIVHKVRGQEVPVQIPDAVALSKVVAVSALEAGLASAGPRPGQPLDFALVRVAAECKAWKEQDAGAGQTGLEFRGGAGWYEDPIFDVTLMNRRAEPVLLTAVGVETVRLGFNNYKIMGGGGAEPVPLHRTYLVELPDLWQALAEKERELGGEHREVDVERLAVCRLPDPILLEGHRPYRFSLHLFDYVEYCPTEVELVFWARTDSGEARSRNARLTYLIGSDIPPLSRYRRMLRGEEEAHEQRSAATRYLRPEEREARVQRLAYALWERAGRPPGRDQEFWRRAEEELGERLLAEQALWMVHRRPLEPGRDKAERPFVRWQ